MSRHQNSFDRNIARARQQLIEQLIQSSLPGPRRALAGMVETEMPSAKCPLGLA
jgi:hypothetical protein